MVVISKAVMVVCMHGGGRQGGDGGVHARW